MTRQEALELLGFPPNASPTEEELKRAQKRKAIEFHPDRGGDPEKLVQVNRAFDYLTDPKTSGGGGYDQRGEDDSDYPSPRNLFDERLTPINKKVGFKQGWWDPGRNLVVSIPMRGMLAHKFSLLGGNPYSHPVRMKGYAAANALGQHPEGIIIEPGWMSTGDNFDDSYNSALRLIDYAKSAETIKSTLQRELNAIESHNGVSIPSSISGKLLAEADKIAVRTYGVDRLRKNPRILGFDGSVYEVQSFGVKKTK